MIYIQVICGAPNLNLMLGDLQEDMNKQIKQSGAFVVVDQEITSQGRTNLCAGCHKPIQVTT